MGKEAKKAEEARDAKKKAQEVVTEDASVTAKAVAMAKANKRRTESRIVTLNKHLKACQEVDCMADILRKIKRAKRSVAQSKELSQQLIEKAAEKANASDAQKRAMVAAAQGSGL